MIRFHTYFFLLSNTLPYYFLPLSKMGSLWFFLTRFFVSQLDWFYAFYAIFPLWCFALTCSISQRFFAFIFIFIFCFYAYDDR